MTLLIPFPTLTTAPLKFGKCNHSSMLGLELIYVSIRGSRKQTDYQTVRRCYGEFCNQSILFDTRRHINKTPVNVTYWCVSTRHPQFLESKRVLHCFRVACLVPGLADHIPQLVFTALVYDFRTGEHMPQLSYGTRNDSWRKKISEHWSPPLLVYLWILVWS